MDKFKKTSSKISSYFSISNYYDFTLWIWNGCFNSGERETGELTRLFMTPTSVATVIGGKIIGKLSVELIRALILLIAAIILFRVMVKRGILQTFILLVIGALCFGIWCYDFCGIKNSRRLFSNGHALLYANDVYIWSILSYRNYALDFPK